MKEIEEYVLLNS